MYKLFYNKVYLSRCVSYEYQIRKFVVKDSQGFLDLLIDLRKTL